MTNEEIHQLAQRLRIDSIRAAAAASSGHPTSSMSAADLMAVLMARHLRYDYANPENPNNDHLIFSKGHASPLVYAMFAAADAITDEELLTFRQFGSRLEGHPTPVLPWVDVATGSLGQGLPFGVGMALAGKYLDKLPYRTWVLLGDSEMAEGSQWEAFEHAAHYELDNLTAILDVNSLGKRRSRSSEASGTSRSRFRSRTGASRIASRPARSSFRATPSASRSQPARRTEKRSPPSAVRAATSSRSTGRSRTRRSPRSSTR